MNLTVLTGHLNRPASVRELSSGTRLASFDVTTSRPGAPSESVPVAWFDPPAGAAELGEGEEVVVVGRVRRRFFRASGMTQSRTEVQAEAVLRPRQRAKVKRLLVEAGAEIEDLLEAGTG